MAFEALYPEQEVGYNKFLEEKAKGHNRILSVYAPGFGKSVLTGWQIQESLKKVAGCQIQESLKKGERTLFNVYKRGLVKQFWQDLYRDFNIVAGVIMGSERQSLNLPVQVASIDTLCRRGDLVKKYGHFENIICDEAHNTKADKYDCVFGYYGNSIIHGLTATPMVPLKNRFDVIINPIKYAELIQLGRLVPTVIFEPGKEGQANMDGVDNVMTQYGFERNTSQMAERFTQRGVVKGVLENYEKNAKGKRMACFNVNVAHSKQMAYEFTEAGYPSVHIDSETSDNDRSKAIAALKAGHIYTIHNYGIISEGTNIRQLEGVILNREILSKVPYIQITTRGSRSFPGKKFSIVLDHGGNTYRHGSVETYDHFGFKLYNTMPPIEKEEINLRECKACGAINSIEDGVCTFCGEDYRREPNIVSLKDVGYHVLNKDALLLEQINNMHFSDVDRELPLSYGRIYQNLKKKKFGWLVDFAKYKGVKLPKKPSTADWYKFNGEIHEAEKKDGTFRLAQGLIRHMNNLTDKLN